MPRPDSSTSSARRMAMRPPSPPLDESVVEGSRSRQLQEGPKH